jgi:hypothetical protein
MDRQINQLSLCFFEDESPLKLFVWFFKERWPSPRSRRADFNDNRRARSGEIGTLYFPGLRAPSGTLLPDEGVFARRKIESIEKGENNRRTTAIVQYTHS